MLGFCGACTHWDTSLGAAQLNGTGEVKGTCHRLPPVVFMLGRGPDGPVMQTQFPMPHSKMWCSEFSPRIKDAN
jgi:hypothetical protein